QPAEHRPAQQEVQDVDPAGMLEPCRGEQGGHEVQAQREGGQPDDHVQPQHEQSQVEERHFHSSIVATMPNREEVRSQPGELLLEVAWEVCNQVGGIYTVLRSKAPSMVERWGPRYCAVGPWIREKAAVDFEPMSSSGRWGRLVDALATQGLTAHTGYWLVPARPWAVLLESALPRPQLDALKHKLWTDFGIESPSNDPLIDAALGFGEAVRKL